MGWQLGWKKAKHLHYPSHVQRSCFPSIFHGPLQLSQSVSSCQGNASWVSLRQASESANDKHQTDGTSRCLPRFISRKTDKLHCTHLPSDILYFWSHHDLHPNILSSLLGRVEEDLLCSFYRFVHNHVFRFRWPGIICLSRSSTHF